MKKSLITLLFISCTFGLTACSSLNFPGSYKIDIPQGNILKETDIEKLKTGMTKDQVRYVLGSPLTENSFRSNIWTYLYNVKRGSKQLSNKRIDLSFNEKDVLINIQK